MKKYLPFFLLISIFIFSSCTVGGTYYIINQTGEDLVITFEFEQNQKNISRNFSHLKTMKYNGKKIKPRKLKKMTKIESSYDASNHSLQFELRKDEVVFIGGGKNYYDYFRFYGLKKATAKGENTLIELDEKQTNDKVNIRTHNGGFLHYIRTCTLLN